MYVCTPVWCVTGVSRDCPCPLGSLRLSRIIFHTTERGQRALKEIKDLQIKNALTEHSAIYRWKVSLQSVTPVLLILSRQRNANDNSNTKNYITTNYDSELKCVKRCCCFLVDIPEFLDLFGPFLRLSLIRQEMREGMICSKGPRGWIWSRAAAIRTQPCTWGAHYRSTSWANRLDGLWWTF